MTTNWVIGIVIIGLILALIIWNIVASNKKRWYKVYTAKKNYLLYRGWNESMWRSNGFYFRFRDEHDREYTFPANGHWVLMMVEVKPNELEQARQEIAADNINVGE
jgi:hypothetical protein